MKIIQFKRSLLLKVLYGVKTQTRRKIAYSKRKKVINRYKVGDVCSLKNSRFDSRDYGCVEIISVRIEKLGSISEADARAEGFASICEFREAWVSIHGRYDDETQVQVITFRLNKLEAVMPDHKDVPLENLRGMAESALSVMRKLVEKPDCYKCRHRGTVPGDCHSCCRHPQAMRLRVACDEYGRKMGWFSHPCNFDPRWLMECDGFEEVVL